MAEEVDPKYTETIIGMSIEEHEKKLAEERAKKAHRRKWSTTLAFLTVFFLMLVYYDFLISVLLAPPVESRVEVRGTNWITILAAVGTFLSGFGAIGMMVLAWQSKRRLAALERSQPRKDAE